MVSSVLFLPGAQKSASTTLFRLLEQHPLICVSPRKEPHYFSKDVLYQGNARAYHEHEFRHCNGKRYRLDASQSYLVMSNVPRRISDLIGDEARFIIILRNPIDRAASAFRHFRARPGGERVRSLGDLTPPNLGSMDLDELLRWEEAEVRLGLASGAIKGRDPTWSLEGFPFRYFYVSTYSKHLERYLEFFPREHFLFLTFEDVTQQQDTAVERIWTFLGLTPQVVAQSPLHANKTFVYKHEGTGEAILALKKRVRSLKKFVPGPLLQMIRSLEESHLMERRNDRFAPEVRQELTRIFAPEVERTQALTGLDLRAWSYPAVTQPSNSQPEQTS